MIDSVYVGIDLGTSAMKGVAVGLDGSVRARARAPYVTRRPTAGAAEQDPADWLAALAVVVSSLAGDVDPARWQAIGLSGMLPTLVLVDSSDRTLGPAITWQDARADEDGAELSAAIGEERLYELTGQRVDGRYLLPMYLRAARADPDGAGRARRLLGAKDYLFAHLTGEIATDPSTASGFGCYGLDEEKWLDEVLDAAAARAPLRPSLPAVIPSTARHPLLAGPARALDLPSGLPIVLGGADSVLGSFSMGAHEHGQVVLLGGTSSVILGVSRDASRDPLRRYLVTPLAGVDGFGLEMDILATGSALDWLAGLLGLEGGAEVLALAAERDPTLAPEFLPYLAPGEQGALWEPGLTGAVLGLSLAATRADLARGLVTGIVLEARRCLAVLDEALGGTGAVAVAGLGATTEPFPRDLADASGRVVHTSGLHPDDHSALGAALLAARALGVEVVVALEEPPFAREPALERAELWRSLAARHERALGAVRDAVGAAGNDEAAPTTPQRLAEERSRSRGR